MKPQKVGKQRRELSHGLPIIQNTGFNQTIIINNPNFNINYIQQANHTKPDKQINNKNVNEYPAYDPKNSSKGIDAWNLNKNLKQFSETRQLGFFKPNQKVRSNSDLQHSPYLSHKIKTNDVKSYSKIKSNATIEQQFLRENRTISTINQTLLIPSFRDRTAATIANPDYVEQSKTTFRKRKFQSKARNTKTNPVINLQRLEPFLKQRKDISQTKCYDIPKTERKAHVAALTTRRNRFVEIEKSSQKIKKTSEQKQQQQNISQMQNSLIIGDSPQKRSRARVQQVDREKKIIKKIYEKSIQKISKCFLSKVDNYFDQSNNIQIPSSKIQFYVTNLHQPSASSYNVDYKSSSVEQPNSNYNFSFDEQKLKHRPRTPFKRKKLYDQML